MNGNQITELLKLPEVRFRDKQLASIYTELRGLGARPKEAEWKARAIHNHKNDDEISTGRIYSDLRKIGVPPIEACKLEVLYWGVHDSDEPETAWELGLIQATEGARHKRKTTKYNNFVL